MGAEDREQIEGNDTGQYWAHRRCVSQPSPTPRALLPATADGQYVAFSTRHDSTFRHRGPPLFRFHHCHRMASHHHGIASLFRFDSLSVFLSCSSRACPLSPRGRNGTPSRLSRNTRTAGSSALAATLGARSRAGDADSRGTNRRNTPSSSHTRRMDNWAEVSCFRSSAPCPSREGWAALISWSLRKNALSQNGYGRSSLQM